MFDAVALSDGIWVLRNNRKQFVLQGQFMIRNTQYQIFFGDIEFTVLISTEKLYSLNVDHYWISNHEFNSVQSPEIFSNR